MVVGRNYLRRAGETVGLSIHATHPARDVETFRCVSDVLKRDSGRSRCGYRVHTVCLDRPTRRRGVLSGLADRRDALY